MSTVENFHHIVFRTKNSRYTLPEDKKQVLISYMRTLSENIGVDVMRINCYLNHVHIFINLPADMALSDYVRKVKSTTSKAFNHHALFPAFEGWARKYGSFSKSREDKDKIINYIKGQEEHHRYKTFAEELEELFGSDFFKDPYNRRDWFDD